MFTRLGSYGTEPPPEDIPELASTRCGILGRDGPVLLLAWLLVAGLFVPLVMEPNIQISFIGGALCLTHACIMCLIMGKGGPTWGWFRWLQLVAMACAAILGVCMRPKFIEYTTFDGRSAGIPPSQASASCFQVLLASLLFTILCSWILPAMGVKFINSSVSWRIAEGDVDDKEIKFRARKASQMVFGYRSLDDLELIMFADTESYTTSVVRALLNNHAYWSGEFAFDYAFHAANEHLFLGCLFCHPAHPYSKWERVFVLVNICLLIVFPVTAFSVALDDNIFRTCLIAVVVTAPRNGLKALLMQVSTKAEAIVLAEHKQKQGTTMVLTPDEQELVRKGRYETLAIFAITASFTALTILFCCYIIRSHDAPLLKTLAENCDGMEFAFYLDLLFDLLLPRHSPDGVLCWGFFQLWWVSREETLASLHKNTDPAGSASHGPCAVA